MVILWKVAISLLTAIERSLVINLSKFDEFMQIFVSEQSKKCHGDGWFGILVASLEALIDIEPKQTDA